MSGITLERFWIFDKPCGRMIMVEFGNGCREELERGFYLLDDARRFRDKHGDIIGCQCLRSR